MQDARSTVQKKAVDAAIKGFKKASRGKVIMPCGTGKTRVGMKVMERLKSKVTIVLCPALSLVKQNLECYLQNSKLKFTPLVVCSDESTAKQARDEHGIEAVTTTDPYTIRAFVDFDDTFKNPIVIFATYQSSGQLSAAWSQGGMPEIDLIVFDEAHRTAGVEGVFSEALHDKNLKAKHRLFMTATPRTMRASAKRKAAVDGVEIVCMDDESLYGKEFYRLNFSEAVSLGLLTDYKVIIFGVTADMVAKWTQEHGGESIVAARVGLIKAMEKFKIRKVISYHSSTKSSKQFSGELKNGEMSYPDLFKTMKGHGIVAGQCWARSLDAKTPVHERKREMSALEQFDRKCRAVISNCRVLTEGVDAPAVDAVAFMDPKNSVTDIVQAIGRCMRLCEHKETSYVIVPVFVSGNEGDEDAGKWSQVMNVVRALKDHDSRLEAAVSAYRKAKGDGKSEEAAGKAMRKMFPQLMIVGGPENWAGKVEPRIFEGIDRGRQWTDEEIKKEVDKWIRKHKKTPSRASSNIFNCIQSALYKKGKFGLAQWLHLNGYETLKNRNIWSFEEIDDEVKKHIKENGSYPRMPYSGALNKIHNFLKKTKRGSLNSWLISHGFKTIKKEFTDEEIFELVQSHISERHRIPQSRGEPFSTVNWFLIKTRKITLCTWLILNGFKKSINSRLHATTLKTTTNATHQQNPRRTPRPSRITRPFNGPRSNEGDHKKNNIRNP